MLDNGKFPGIPGNSRLNPVFLKKVRDMRNPNEHVLYFRKLCFRGSVEIVGILFKLKLKNIYFSCFAIALFAFNENYLRNYSIMKIPHLKT